MILSSENPIIPLVDLEKATVGQVYDALEMLQVKGFLDKQRNPK